MILLACAERTNLRRRNAEEGKQVSIRRMVPEEVEGILPIVASTPFNPWSKKMLLEELAQPYSHSYLLCLTVNPGKPLSMGFLCFRLIGEESELLNLCIASEFRQQGWGKRLMSFYITCSERKGARQYFLEVSESNLPAIQLYHSFGFRSIGKRNKFYQGKEDALLMTRSTS